MFLMIPVTKNYGEFLVILVCFVGWMQNERATEAVDILALIEKKISLV